jgi:broad specificity phosphatase PhoE
MTISANGRALAIATKDLLLRWEETKQFWQDAKAADFEQVYLSQLQSAVDRATPVFVELVIIVTRVRSECE